MVSDCRNRKRAESDKVIYRSVNASLWCAVSTAGYTVMPRGRTSLVWGRNGGSRHQGGNTVICAAVAPGTGFSLCL